MVAIDVRQHLWQHPLFEGLDDEQRAILTRRVNLHTFKRNERIIEGHTPARHWFLIEQGLVKVHGWQQKPPRDVVKGLFGPGEIIGEEALIFQNRYLYDAHALCDTVALAVPRKLTRTLAHNNPDWMWSLMQLIGKRLQLAERQVQALSSSDARGRVVFAMAAKSGTRCWSSTTSPSRRSPRPPAPAARPSPPCSTSGKRKTSSTSPDTRC